VLLIALSSAGGSFAAQSDTSKAIDEIFEACMKDAGVSDLQELVWYYADNAGAGEEWYIISLRQYYPGELDFSEYRKAYEEYAPTISEKSAASRLKAALTLQALGSDSSFIDKAAEEATGQAGIMSLIYGLHVLNNGAQCASHTIDSVIDELLELQFEDGGWAVMGDNGDVDVTAMAVQALAPSCSEEKVKASVDRAIELLALRQKENGHFTSFGDENPESAAQVLVALSSLGTDCAADERFIKNGKTIIDMISSFRVSEGKYAHAAGDSANSTATMQTLYSFISYEMMLSGKGTLYVFGEFSEPSVQRPERESHQEGSSGGEEADGPGENDSENTAKSIKPVLYIITAAAAAAACVILAIMKKRSYKSYLFVVIVAAIAACCITFINIEKPSDYYGSSDDITDPIRTEIYISAATVDGEASHIPAGGLILDRTEIVVNKGQTAFDQLIAAVKANSIQIEFRGGYVAGIANIYELDHGDLSGWMYRVNGEFASVNSNEFVLSEGDFVEWLYTRNIGKDIGNEYTGE